MTEIVVTVADIRQCRMCMRGAREFYKRHKLDWGQLLSEGTPVELIEATGDAMALKVVEVARGRQQ